MSELTNQTASDIQTIHVFAIAQFLLVYHPVHSVLYALNPDSDIKNTLTKIDKL